MILVLKDRLSRRGIDPSSVTKWEKLVSTCSQPKLDIILALDRQLYSLETPTRTLVDMVKWDITMLASSYTLLH